MGEWIHVCIWLSPFTSPETTTTLLISYAPIQNKRFLKRFFLPQVIYRVNTIPVKLLKIDTDKVTLKGTKKYKGHRIIKIILEKRNKLEDLLYLISKSL